jgi:hypothetical protein
LNCGGTAPDCHAERFGNVLSNKPRKHTPKSNLKYWTAKLTRHQERDAKTTPAPPRRSIEECIALLPADSPATIDEDFAGDVAAAVIE